MEPKNISGSAEVLPVRATTSKRKLSRKRGKKSHKPFTLSTKRRFSEKRMRPECNYTRMLETGENQEMHDESLKKSAKKSSAPGAPVEASADDALKEELK